MFRIILVMDILNGRVVHAVRGERAYYKPIKSKVCDSSSPHEIISTIMPKEVYIADLNRLQGMGDNLMLIKNISSRVKTMIDIGAKSIKEVEQGLKIAHNLVLGTETSSLKLIEKASEKRNIVVSIDLKQGKVITKDESLKLKPEELVKALNDYEIQELIILDLSKVGTSHGANIEFLERMVSLSSHDILFGGGIKDIKEVYALKEIGVKGVLVATAIHNGNIPLTMVRHGHESQFPYRVG